jgi:hypothetical protein
MFLLLISLIPLRFLTSVNPRGKDIGRDSADKALLQGSICEPSICRLNARFHGTFLPFDPLDNRWAADESFIRKSTMDGLSRLKASNEIFEKDSYQKNVSSLMAGV